MKTIFTSIVLSLIILNQFTSISFANPSIPISSPLGQPCPVMGDTNICDGKINILDYSYLSSQMGKNNHKADLNGDNIVNILDYTILSINFGK